MITKQNALDIGKAIIMGMNEEIDNQTPYNGAIDNNVRWGIRGAAYRSLQNVYYVLDVKVRAQFKYDYNFYVDQCGWE